MSGIVGIYFRDGRTVNPTVLTHMVNLIAHRGPDGINTWFEGSVGLGHCMLWTTPESAHETLPFVNSTGEICITADARIDNRDVLLKSLAVNSRDASEISDSEIILMSYEKWGTNCLEKLLGDFSFVIWDKRHQKMFCARDHMGVKSLYYFLSAEIFGFASEIKALLEIPFVPIHINEVRIADYLVNVVADKTSTFYQHIYRLPPAHFIRLNSTEHHINSYWSLGLSNPLNLKSDEEYAAAFYEIFEETVRSRIRSAYKIGFALSGGLDSSSIVCTALHLMKNHHEQSLHSFSAIFPDLQPDDLHEVDERHFIEEVLSLGKFTPHYVRADNVSPFIDFDQLLEFTDEPYFAPNLFMYWILYRAASQEGARIYLDGIDGDVTVSHGHEYLIDLFRTGKIRFLIAEASAISNQPLPSAETWKLIWQFGVRPLIPSPIVNIKRKLIQNTSYKLDLLNPELVNKTHYQGRLQSIIYNSLKGNSAREVHTNELNAPHLPLNLELLDKVAAVFSLDIRLPFFDRRLVEFCLAIPPRLKLSQGRTRYIFRYAMEGVLPKEIQWRSTKANFMVNFRQALFNYERETINQTILNETRILEPYINMPALHTAYQNFIDHPSENRDAFTLYSAISLAWWLKKYIAH